jgi:hypothetical protein
MAPMPGRLNHLLWDVVAAPKDLPLNQLVILTNWITQQERSPGK